MAVMYSFLDFETTGLDHTKDQITEFGIVRWDPDHSHKYTYTRGYVQLEGGGGRKLTDFIVKLTGITEDKLKKEGMLLADAKKAIANFIEGTTLVAQFASFDMGFIKEIDIPDFMCTRTMTQILYPYEKSGLADTCERLGIEMRNHHTALDDALSCKAVFEYYRDKFDISYFKNLMLDTPDRPLRYVPYNAIVLERNPLVRFGGKS